MSPTLRSAPIPALNVNKIAVGSTNPVKIEAVHNAAHRIWPDVRVRGYAVPSGISDQPMSDQEMIQGARNRATESLQISEAELAVGLEGGTVETDMGMLLTGWVVALDRQGQIGIACSGSLLLPEIIAQGVRQGHELGPWMDHLLNAENTKEHQGTVGILTAGLVERAAAFERGVIYALSPFLNPHWYDL